MKTFSKKLISLMLVALMLVAAMPMAAFADEVDGSEEYQDLVVNKDVNVEVTVEDEDGQSVDIKSGTLANFPMDFEKKSDSTKKDWVKKALTAVGLKASNYTYDASSGGYYDENSLFAVTVKIAPHTHKLEVVDKDDPEYEDNAEYHVLRCTICGQETNEIHKWTVVKDSGKDESEGHLVKCVKCGYESTDRVPHTDSEITQTVKAQAATCEKNAVTAKTVYSCGYVEGGEEQPDTALGHNFVNGKCTRCGKKDEATRTFVVKIVHTKGNGTIVDGATCDLTAYEVSTLKKSSVANAKAILAKTSSTDSDDNKLIQAYRGSISTCYSDMYLDETDDTIEILVSKDLINDATANSEKVTVTVVDGSLTDTRELTVGKSYFNYDLTLGNNNNKSLASVRITYEANGRTYTRTAKKGDSDAKVQAYDTQVELLWDAKQVTINFYRNAADGAEKVSTMTIRAGETIEGLPKLDGEYVSWYLESGELLQEGRSYDFVSTTMKAYPYAGGEVYLQIYKNGDTKTPVSNDPVNVTAKVQKNGIISASDLTKIIENRVGKKNLKITGLFDFEGWEEYKASKSTKAASSTIDVGTADDRTGVQFLYVMVNGGTSSNSKADSSNPKTGDNAMLGTAATVMAVAVIGLGATAVVLKKKEQF